MAEETRSEYRLKTKIGEHEFDASGPEDAVREQFKLWMEMIRSGPAAQSSPPKPKNESAGASGNGNEESLDQSTLQRVFLVGKDGLISLRALPRTGEHSDADALIMLIYGYLALNNEHHVTGLTLTSAARQSGLQVTRVDRVISAREAMVQRAGARRGTRYSLNNAGISHARRLVQELYQ